MEINKILVSFTGNKAEVKNSVKVWCDKSGVSMNETFVAFASKLMKEKKLQKEILQEINQ